MFPCRVSLLLTSGAVVFSEVVALLPRKACLLKRNISFLLFHSRQSPSRHCQMIPNQINRS